MIFVFFFCSRQNLYWTSDRIDGLMQERRNSIANALQLRLSCTNPGKFVSVNILPPELLILLTDPITNPSATILYWSELKII